MTTTISWPTSLPQQFLVDSYTRAPTDNLIRTTMDAAIAKQRSRFTHSTKSIKAAMLMTEDQLVTFRTFFEDTLSNGALSFNIPKRVPAIGTEEVRFSQGLYEESFVGPLWRVNMNLEVLP